MRSNQLLRIDSTTLFAYIADRKRLVERGDGIAFGPEFVSDIIGVIGGRDCPTNTRVIHFLRVIQVIAARVARGVKVADPFDVFPDRADHIAFHDLHVVDVVKQFDARAVNPFADGHAPGGMIALITGVIDL